MDDFAEISRTAAHSAPASRATTQRRAARRRRVVAAVVGTNALAGLLAWALGSGGIDRLVLVLVIVSGAAVTAGTYLSVFRDLPFPRRRPAERGRPATRRGREALRGGWRRHVPGALLVIGLAAVAATPLAPDAHGAPQQTTVSSGPLATPIADSTWIVPGSAYSPGLTESTLQVPDLGTVTDVDLRLRVSHTLVGDVGVFLEAPDGTSVFVASPEGTGDDFGTGATDCTGTPTVLDDEASSSLDGATAPFAGAFRPHEPLSAFDGKAAGGTWELSFIDVLPPGDAGTLHCWELVITYDAERADLSLRGSDRPDPVKAGKQVRYTFQATNDGSVDVTNVVATARIPAGATFVSGRSSQGSCKRSGRTLTCRLGELESGRSATVSVVVKAPKTPRTLTATARVSGDQADADGADNRVQVKTRVVPA